ncbi:hypothetical protein HDU83_001975 [Entophlyctis luteolus]|nr:hypothetical protein HDU83_001975 [Entophlyctis luteolus]
MAANVATAHFRQKDDVWNAPVAGLAAGFVVGARGKKIVALVGFSDVTAPCAAGSVPRMLFYSSLFSAVSLWGNLFVTQLRKNEGLLDHEKRRARSEFFGVKGQRDPYSERWAKIQARRAAAAGDEDGCVMTQERIAHLLAQSQDYEAEGRWDRAVHDLRSALALVSSVDHAQRQSITSALTKLLVRAANATAPESESSRLASLVQRVCDSSSPLPDRAVAAQQSAALVASPGTSGIGECLGAAEVSSLLDTLDVAILAPSVVTLLSFAKPDVVVAAICADRRRASLLTPVGNVDVIRKGLAVLGDCMASAKVAEAEFPGLFIDCVNNALDPLVTTGDVRLCAINALVTGICDENAAMLVIRHPSLLARILQTSNDDSESVRNCCPIAIGRILEPITTARNQPNAAEVKKNIKIHVMAFLESTSSKDKTTGLMILSAIFMANADYAAGILLTDGVIPEIMDVVEFETEPVQFATISMLNAACMDQSCRKLIASQDCSPILMKLWKNSSSSNRLRSAAASTLVKVMFADKEIEKRMFEDSELANGFIREIKALDSTNADAIATSLESLTYLSAKGYVKELIVKDSGLLQKLFSIMKMKESKALQYGTVSIFVNLTTPRKRLTDEEEQIMKLREVSGEVVPKLDPLDNDAQVDKRTGALVAAGIVAPLCAASAGASVSLSAAIGQLFLNICSDKRHRGRVVQDGGVRALTLVVQKLAEPIPTVPYLVATQALAKIAITTDPSIAFKPISRALDLVRPLIHLLDSEATTLQQFEGLMALTNLASFDDDVRAKIVSGKGVKAMEFLQFSENVMVRRAATEALCNMMLEPSVFESYIGASDGGKSGADEGKLKMMIMLCDVEDYETRRAASGALAILSASPAACRSIVRNARGLDTILGLLFGEEEGANPELIHRGVEICKNIAAVGGSIAQQLDAVGIVKILRGLVLNPVQEISHGAIEALQNLQKAGINVLAKAPAAAKITEID